MLVDVIVLGSYKKIRKEIGSFNNLFEEDVLKDTESRTKEIIEQEQI